MRIIAKMIATDHLSLVSHEGLLTISDPQNSALAGVGTPMNDVVCRSSRLNFANLRAEKAAMMNAV